MKKKAAKKVKKIVLRSENVIGSPAGVLSMGSKAVFSQYSPRKNWFLRFIDWANK